MYRYGEFNNVDIPFMYRFGEVNNVDILFMYRCGEVNNVDILFMCRYGDFRLIDIPGLREVMPVTMESFMKHVERSSTEGVKVLRDMWLPECCAIVDMRRDQVESWMPQDDEVGTSVLFVFFYIQI